MRSGARNGFVEVILASGDAARTVDDMTTTTAPSAHSPAAQHAITPVQLIRPFWIAGAALQMLDALTTFIAIRFHSDGIYEANGFMNSVFQTIGLGPALVLKFVIGAGLFWKLARLAETGEHRVGLFNYGIGMTHTAAGRRRPAFVRKSQWRIQRSSIMVMAFALCLMGAVIGNNLRVLSLKAWS